MYMSSLQKALEAARYPVALTGAGISAPSGIPTFDMSWKGQPVRDFLTRDYFTADPYGFFELFREMVKWGYKEPNLAHRALSHFDVSIVTQNIDSLHQKAGSRRVIEVHGNCKMLICRQCGNIADSSRLLAEGTQALRDAAHCDRCAKLFDIDVVLYGDSLRDWWGAVEEASKADLFLVIGTSLTTYPANQLPRMAQRNGAKQIHINEDCIGAFSFVELG